MREEETGAATGRRCVRRSPCSGTRRHWCSLRFLFGHSCSSYLQEGENQAVRLRLKDRAKRNPAERTAVLAAPLSEKWVSRVTRDASETQTESQRVHATRTRVTLTHTHTHTALVSHSCDLKITQLLHQNQVSTKPQMLHEVQMTKRRCRFRLCTRKETILQTEAEKRPPSHLQQRFSRAQGKRLRG